MSKHLIIFLGIYIHLLTSCTQSQIGIENNHFYIHDGTGLIPYAFIAEEIVFKENGSGYTKQNYKQNDSKLSYFDWEYDKKRNWVKVTFLNTTQSLYFIFRDGFLQRTNCEKHDADIWVDKNLIDFRFYDPKKAGALKRTLGNINQSGISLRTDPQNYYESSFGTGKVIMKSKGSEKVELLAYTGDYSWTQFRITFENKEIDLWIESKYIDELDEKSNTKKPWLENKDNN